MSYPNARIALAVAVNCLLAAPLLHAADTAGTASSAGGDATAGTEDVTLPTIVVTAELLNEKRASIETQTGASTYIIDDAAIAAAPGGSNVLLNQVRCRRRTWSRTHSDRSTCAVITTTCSTA